MKKNPWKKFISREGVDVTTTSGLDVVFYDCIKNAGYKIQEPFFSLVKDRILTHYLCIDPYIVGKKIYNKDFARSAQVKKYYGQGLKLLKIYKQSSSLWNKRTKNNSNNLLSAFRVCRKQFEQINYGYSIWPWWGLESWQTDCDELINNLIIKRGLDDLREAMLATIYKPWKKTAIVRLQSQLKQPHPDLTALKRQYQFLRSWSLVWYRPLDAKWLRNMAKSLKAQTEIKGLSRRKIYRLLRPNRREKYFLDIAPFLIFFKDWRDDLRRSHVFYWSFLFDRLAEHFQIERNDLGYLSLEELEKAVAADCFPAKLVEGRKKFGCIITGSIKGLKMVVKPTTGKTYISRMRLSQKQGHKKVSITGLIAYKGEARGKVKIVRTYHDTKRVKTGEILVANTTHPNYLPAMQRAAAFVTNEGGIISHAAIVARELKKPCIVGSKTATMELKDGDMVEVDANKGVVKIIK